MINYPRFKRLLKNSCALALLLLITTISQAKTILIIESYHPEYNWDKNYIQAFEDQFAGKHKIEVTYLDTKRIAKSEFEASADRVLAEFHRIKPDLVVLGDDNANLLMIPRLSASNVPVVFLGVNSPISKLNLDKHKNVTGVLERPLYVQTVKHIRKVMKPAPKKMLVLMDNSTTMQAAVNETFGEARSVKIRRTDLDFLLTNDEASWKQAIQNAAFNGYHGIILGTYHTIRNNSDDYVTPDSLISWAHNNSQIPLFAFWDLAVGKGMAAGGYVVAGYDQGRLAARLAHFILKGVPVSTLEPFVGKVGRYIYSKSAMEKWNIKLNTMTASQTFYIE